MRNTNELELLQVTGITVLSLVVYSSGYKKSILNDFLFCIVPQYCAIVFPDRIWGLYLCLAMLLNYSGLRKPEGNKSTEVVGYLRFAISVITVIAIYAVDFSVFEKRLGKSHFFGISMMDIGVGSFIYNSGIVGYKARSKRHIRSYLILVLLGFVRCFTVRWFNIGVNPREYGIYINFYFLLALVNFIYSLIRSRYNFLLGLLVVTVYEIILRFSGLTSFIFSDKRETFLEKNKEGLVATVPYISILLMTTEVGRICFSEDKTRKKAWKVLGMTAVFGCLYTVFNFSSEGSRRLGNGAFVFWILALHSFHIGMYLLFESTIALYNPLTAMFCSFNMMFVFLFSNLIVLFGNVFFDLKSFSTPVAHLNLLSYLVAVFSIPTLLTSRFDLRWMGLGYRSR
ncbi:putative membrane protein [Encephalitozoon cuniculi EcunIII-L]|nr:putative membrane protein [Encephalitozoon cuniculi EcunIII-L]